MFMLKWGTLTSWCASILTPDLVAPAPSLDNYSYVNRQSPGCFKCIDSNAGQRFRGESMTLTLILKFQAYNDYTCFNIMICVLSFNNNDLRPFRETLTQMVWVILTQFQIRSWSNYVNTMNYLIKFHQSTWRLQSNPDWSGS